MKLSDIILTEGHDYDKYKHVALDITKELTVGYGDYNPMVSMGHYVEDGPNAGKGYGSVEFKVEEALPDDTFRQVVAFLKTRKYNVTSEANYYDDDGDRYYYPKIQFEFSQSDVK
jgi:hypothetical protein|tara:strand:+ start:9022 stop:9366 length:345 start_codon:yes stop_codon:yes gene_type:complete